MAAQRKEPPRRSVGARIQAAVKELLLPYPQNWWTLGGQWGPAGPTPVIFRGSRINYTHEAGDLRLNSAVMACVGWKARTFPEAPVRIMQRSPSGDDEDIPLHPLEQKLARPNPWYSGQALWQATITDFDITGNAYWLKFRSGSGAKTGTGMVQQLWYEPSLNVRVLGDAGEFITKYQVRRVGVWYDVDPKNIVHFRQGIDPTNPRIGAAPLMPALREVFTDNEASNYLAAILKKMGIPGVIISPDPSVDPPTEEEVLAVKRAYNENFGGDNRGDTMVMRGATRVTTLGFSPDQIKVREIRFIPEERISALLGIPAMVAGLGAGLTRSTFSNYAEAREAAYENTIIPMQSYFAAELNTQLLPDFADEATKYVMFDTAKVRVLQPDQDKLSTRVVEEWKSDLIYQNEGRVRLGYDPLDDGDRLFSEVSASIGGGAPPLTARIVDTTNSGGNQPGQIPATTESGDSGGQDGTQGGAGDAGTVQDTGTGKVYRPRKARRLLLKESAAGAGDPEQALIEAIIGEFTNNLVVAFSALGKSASDIVADPSLDPALLLRPYVPAATIVQKIEPILRAQFMGMHTNLNEKMAEIIADTLNVTPDSLTVGRPYVTLLAAQSSRLNALIPDITRQTARAISDGAGKVSRGEMSIEDFRTSISTMVSGSHLYPGIAAEKGDEAATEYRAENIAVTETRWAHNQSSVAMYDASGIVESVYVTDGEGCGWSSHTDPRKAHGMTVSFDDARAFPMAHPRCVRRFHPIVIEG